MERRIPGTMRLPDQQGAGSDNAGVPASLINATFLPACMAAEAWLAGARSLCSCSATARRRDGVPAASSVRLVRRVLAGDLIGGAQRFDRARLASPRLPIGVRRIEAAWDHQSTGAV